MTDRPTPVNLGPRLFLPFVMGDLLLLAAAFVIWQQGNRPMTSFEVSAFAGCIALGAWLGVWPFRLRHQAELKLVETATLTDTVKQIEQIEDVADRIDTATGQWQTAQEHAGRTLTAAREVVDRMTAEQGEFRAFMQKAEDTERNHLRLEVSKLRRAEGDWLQVLVRILDHVYALYLAGVRSGQPQLIGQFTQFQNACRDVARRVGMVPIVPTLEAPFDTELHQLPDPNQTPPAGVTVVEILALGYAYQGQLLRRAVVAVEPPSAPVPTTPILESFTSRPSSPSEDNVPPPIESVPVEATAATAPPTESAPSGPVPVESAPSEPAPDTERVPPADDSVPASDRPQAKAAPPDNRVESVPPPDEPAAQQARPGPGEQPQLPLSE